MRFKCRKADISFLDIAPVKFEFRVFVNSTLNEVFDALQNPLTWTKWFPGMTKASDIVHESNGPSRIVTLNYVIRFKEDFIVWEPPSRIAYRVSAVSLPYADELVEEFSLSEQEGGVEIRYRVGMRVHHSLSLIAGLVEKVGESSYDKALKNLKNYLER